MKERELLKILYTSGKENHLLFSHDNKVWIMPQKAIEGGMDMYQPSSKKGKMLKKTIQKRGKKPFFARNVKTEYKELEIDPAIKKQLEDLLGISEFYVATYMGELWTSQNDKAVLQIYSDDEIYAYVKVTVNADNAKRFEKEVNALNLLREAGIEYVPRVTAYLNMLWK